MYTSVKLHSSHRTYSLRPFSSVNYPVCDVVRKSSRCNLDNHISEKTCCSRLFLTAEWSSDWHSNPVDRWQKWRCNQIQLHAHHENNPKSIYKVDDAVRIFTRAPFHLLDSKLITRCNGPSSQPNKFKWFFISFSRLLFNFSHLARIKEENKINLIWSLKWLATTDTLPRIHGARWDGELALAIAYCNRLLCDPVNEFNLLL